MVQRFETGMCEVCYLHECSSGVLVYAAFACGFVFGALIGGAL